MSSIETRSEFQEVSEVYQHWSKNINFKGSTLSPKDYPQIEKDPKRFKKTGEMKALELTLKEKYKQDMVKKYGADWKNELKHLKATN